MKTKNTMKKTKRIKTGGRTKGTPNKDTRELRERISELIDMHFDRLSDDLLSLQPKERIEAMTKLLEYSLPKLQRMEMDTGDISQQIIFNEVKTYQPKTLDDWYNLNRGKESDEDNVINKHEVTHNQNN